MDSIDGKLGRIASKIKDGSKEERIELAKEHNTLAQLLLDLYAEAGAGPCASIHRGTLERD